MSQTGPDAAGGAKPAGKPLFLERQSYKRRRLTDAARLLPLFGAALFAVPLLWSGGGGDGAAPPVATSRAILYIFGAWAALIAVTAVLGLAMRRLAHRGGDPGAE